MIRLTTIGTGTGAPSPSRVASAHLIEAGSVRLLIDCGNGALFRMSNVGVDWMSITHVAISHYHADHISDLPGLLYAWRYGGIPYRAAPVEIMGPPGFGAFFTRLDAAFGGNLLKLGFPVALRELEPGVPSALSDVMNITARRVPHTEESVAYSIRAGGLRIVYTGDTAPDPSLAEWARGCDLLIAECSLPAELAVPAHLTPETCAELAESARPAALVLTHFYPPVELLDVKRIVSSRYDGPIHIARDGWTIELED